ncbi:Queuine tRNA-ribosyltransferase subunit qtrtd1 [Podila verticillata]|nr:Queuine tRNA-ribosyltransferase subunit qtrtd1 [Podila verticillata]
MLTFDLQSTGIRRGRLSIAKEAGEDAVQKRVIETPGCLMYTAKGSVPHLTPDNVRLQDFGGVNVSMEHLLQNHHPAGLKNWDFDLAKFLHLEEFILLCQLRDTSTFTKLAPTTDRFVTLTTFQGIRQFTLHEYIEVVRAYRPDIVIAFTDNIAETFRDPSTVLPGKKRVQRSVDRSLKWLDQTLRARAGGEGEQDETEKKANKNESRKEQRKKARFQATEASEVESGSGSNATTPASTRTVTPTDSTTIKEEGTRSWTEVAVFAQVHGSDLVSERVRSAQETAKRDVQGFVLDVSGLVESKSMTKNAALNCIKVSTDHLPQDKPRLVYGVQTPEDVLKAITMGADLFDTSYPFHLTEDGKASLYYFKKPAISGSETTTSIGEKRWINLWDDEHGDKFVPLLDGCECYACKDSRHTRAYINHLLKTHEMLATVLLMSHNMHQYSKFFASVRETIEDDTFQKESVLFQERFGVEPESTGEIHAAQAIVEASLTRRANRLEGAEEGVVEAIGLGGPSPGTPMPQKRHSEDTTGHADKKPKPEEHGDKA